MRWTLVRSACAVPWMYGCLVLGTGAQAEVRYFIGLPSGGNASWGEPSNWTNGALPTAADSAYILDADIFDRNVALDLISSVSELQVGNSGGGVTTLHHQSGADLTAEWEVIGGFLSPEDVVKHSRGVHIQDGGTSNIGGLFVGGFTSYYWYDPTRASSRGTYVMNAGILNASSLYVGQSGHGTFEQNGGTVNIGSFLEVGAPQGSIGVYYLRAGALTVNGSEYVGYSGAGTFTHSGGTHVVAGVLSLGMTSAAGCSGTYILNGPDATLVADQELIARHNPASFIQSAGSHVVQSQSVVGYINRGRYELGGGSFSIGGELDVGFYGWGTFSHSGGTVTVGTSVSPGTLSLGVEGWGTYSLSSDAASLTVFGTEYLGYNGQGVFDQSAGSHVVHGILDIGGYASHYLLSGGTLSVMGTQRIGLYGPGAFTQTGGSHSVSNTVVVAVNGIFALSGGSLTTPLLDVGPGGTFDYSGGSLHTQTLSLAGRMSLGAGSGRTPVVSALDITGSGRLDLNDNAAIVTTGNEATIAARIKSALENGGAYDWAGPGIGSSFAAMQNAAAGSYLYGVGVLLNNDGSGNLIHTSFAGQPLSGNEVLVKFTYFGDADLSGSIDATDYSLIDNGYVNSLSGWINGDFDYSGSIDATDYALIDNAYVNQSGPLAEALIAGHARLFGNEYLIALRAVQGGVMPEPAVVAGVWLVVAAVATGRGARSRRRSGLFRA
ncbi:hypothetical protein [Fontivita pretiosa]|uniref:hypothetical protein n=1 Tax=Fontivita pretiosa TaxID=2989684 RepID=UPI003D178AF7